MTRKVKVHVPKGVNTGTRLRVTGEGEGGFRQAPPGDLYVEISVRSHPRYDRHENDLLGLIKATYTQVLLGADVEVDTFDGKKQLKIPESSQPGSVLRLKGLGVPDIHGGPRGDICLRLEVEFPKKLKKQEKKLLEELSEIRGEREGEKEKKGFFS